MDLNQSYFALFGLPETFAVDVARLERARLAVQSQVHPDRFASGSDRDKRLAMQWAAQANAAYLTLKNPVQRASYLCERRGVPIQAENNTAMPAEFLLQQMQWRETLDDLRQAADPAGLQALQAEVQTQRAERLEAIRQALDEQNAPEVAAEQVRALLFLDRFAEELRRTADALPQPAAR
ncbi:MAG: Fe-S protein assembly co-chaperone HscB [Thiomonas sp.]|uniref:Fe-S protein assembly co-chaperone HscB n=1 Tax=Thiomonas sp. TaxID=2047785 RepID=UPI002A363913|nr:Fe-S protein assembly co-chaperone HscB [Thiomonas sp.]MDY0328937.1 Fe-S protein assembly co-chaperone HscB [Thiomonas sp.]